MRIKYAKQIAEEIKHQPKINPQEKHVTGEKHEEWLREHQVYEQGEISEWEQENYL